jgi:hypothetical protein
MTCVEHTVQGRACLGVEGHDTMQKEVTEMSFSSAHAGRPEVARNVSSDHKDGHNKKKNRALANDTLRNAFLVAAATLLAYALTFPVSQ